MDERVLKVLDESETSGYDAKKPRPPVEAPPELPENFGIFGPRKYEDTPAHLRNKHLKDLTTGELTDDPREVPEVGAPYGLMGSGADPELLMRIARDLEATYKEPVEPPRGYKAPEREEYVPDRSVIDPVPECLKPLFNEPVSMPEAY